MEALSWAVVIFPDFAPAQREIIDRIRAAYDPLATTIDPHITLVFPFTAPLPKDVLLAHMRSSAAAIAPFEITLRGITGEQDEWLFLNIKRGNDHIIALHDQLYSGPLAPYLEPRYTYVPHLTVGHLAPGARFDAALRETNSLAETFHTTARAITAYRIAGNEQPGEQYSVVLS